MVTSASRLLLLVKKLWLMQRNQSKTIQLLKLHGANWATTLSLTKKQQLLKFLQRLTLYSTRLNQLLRRWIWLTKKLKLSSIRLSTTDQHWRFLTQAVHQLILLSTCQTLSLTLHSTPLETSQDGLLASAQVVQLLLTQSATRRASMFIRISQVCQQVTM